LLETLIAGIDRTASDMVAPKIMFHHDQNKIWSAGGGLDARRAYSGFHHGYGETDHGQFDQARPVQHAPACCLLIRDEVFKRIGFMDARYFVYVEDTDFCYRAMRAGLTITYLPEARVLHKAHSLTGGLFSPFMMRYTTRNRTYFMLKHFGKWRGFWYVVAYQIHLLIQFSPPVMVHVCLKSDFLEGCGRDPPHVNWRCYGRTPHVPALANASANVLRLVSSGFRPLHHLPRGAVLLLGHMASLTGNWVGFLDFKEFQSVDCCLFASLRVN
jgi:hypothetical protein